MSTPRRPSRPMAALLLLDVSSDTTSSSRLALGRDCSPRTYTRLPVRNTSGHWRRSGSRSSATPRGRARSPSPERGACRKRESMSLRSSMTLSEAGREVLRIAREYWPSIAAAAVLGAGSLVLFAVLRRHEDAQIRRVLELAGRYLSSAAGRSLETRVLEVVELARRSEGYTEPDSARWARDVQALADRDPALRAFEWRDA